MSNHEENGAEQDAPKPKTPLEMVREHHAEEVATLAEGRAHAEGKSLKARSENVENNPDPTPDVVGAGPPSSARNFPNRRNHSHGE